MDTKEFEHWLSTLLQWLKVNKVCGPELDSERVEFAAIHLEGIALTWFEDNVDGVYRRHSSWSFKDVITGLYDRFIHDNATNDATERFWHAEYNAEEGVMSFYHKLERYAARMICAPDRFTSKSQLLAGLPTSITSFILERGCSAETSTTDTLLHYARSAETVEWTKKRLKENRRTVGPSRSRALPSSSKPTKVKEPSPTRSRERSRDCLDRCDRSCYRDQSRRYPRRGEEGTRQNHDWQEEKKDSRSTPSGSRPTKNF